jgi:cell fate regulator YaaT (PSP1 superfamily)
MTDELYTSSTKTQFNDQRFERISEKISRIQNSTNESNDGTLSIMESKLYKVETEIQSRMKDFDHKSKFLIDEFEFVTKLFERNVELNEAFKKKINVEIKSFQSRIKEFYDEEQEKIIIILENNFEKFEKEFNLAKEQIQLEREELNLHIMKLKDFIDLELSKINSLAVDTEITRSKRIEEISSNLNEELEYFYNLV